MTGAQRFHAYLRIIISAIVLLGLWFCWVAFHTLRVLVGIIVHMFFVPMVIVVAAVGVFLMVRIARRD